MRNHKEVLFPAGARVINPRNKSIIQIEETVYIGDDFFLGTVLKPSEDGISIKPKGYYSKGWITRKFVLYSSREGNKNFHLKEKS